jgi:hypothetical protein
MLYSSTARSACSGNSELAYLKILFSKSVINDGVTIVSPVKNG